MEGDQASDSDSSLSSVEGVPGLRARGQVRFISQTLKVLTLVPSDNPPVAPTLPRLSGHHLRAEHFVLQALALFLVLDPEDDRTAVTSFRGTRTMSFVAAKDRHLRQDDYDAMARLKSAIQASTPGNQKGLFDAVVRNCHRKMNDELAKLLEVMRDVCPTEAFSLALHAYSGSSTRLAGARVPLTSFYSDDDNVELRAYMEKSGISDIFVALKTLYADVATRLSQAFIPVSLPSQDDDSLWQVCTEWRAVARDASILVRSDFMEHMTWLEELSDLYNISVLQSLQRLRYALFRIALYQLMLNMVSNTSEKYPKFAKDFQIIWIAQQPPQTYPLRLPRHSARAARQVFESWYLRIVDEDKFDAWFSDSGEWRPDMNLRYHPEMQLLRYIIVNESLLRQEGCRARNPKHPQAICSSDATCCLCARSIKALNRQMARCNALFFNTGTEWDQVRPEEDCTWKYENLGVYGDDVYSAVLGELNQVLLTSAIAK